MAAVTDQVRAKIDAFVQELDSLIRAAALDAVRGALGGGVSTTAPTRATRRAAPVVRKAAPQTRGGKRTPEQVAGDAAKVLAYVKSNAGCSVEQIGKALGLATKELALPILKLRAERSVRTTGQKRGTRYFAGGASPKSAAKAKRVAPKATTKRRKMSPDQKTALLERLAKARAARAAKLAARS